jgi:hypothetical protein
MVSMPDRASMKRRMRKRPPGRHMILAASCLLLLFVIHALGACDVPPSDSWTPDESRDKRPDRLQAAVEDVALEATRIESVWHGFALDLLLRPEEPDVYVVSFQDPLPVRTLLSSPMAGELTIETFHVWLLAEGATTPDTAQVSADTIDWPSDGPRAVAARMRADFLDYLSTRERGLRQLVGESGGASDPGLGPFERQAAEVRQLQAFVRQEGVLLSGFRCACSPLLLLRLAQSVPSVRLRAVEEWPATESPIDPSEPLRDPVIAT